MVFNTPKILVQHSLELFSLPDLYFQVSEMVSDPRFDAKEIGEVIAKDPGLSVRLLKVVNSSFYGFQARIDTVSRAITIIGMDDLKSLVLATAVIDKFSRIPSELVNMTDFWMNSIHCAIIAKLLAKESSVLHCERLFLAGLLHNVGSLVLYSEMPDESRLVLLAMAGDRQLIGPLEQEIIGFTHADVGAELMRLWELPESLSEAVAYYMNPEVAQVHKLDTYLLNLAFRLSQFSEQDDFIPELVAELSEHEMSMLRLDLDQVKTIMQKTNAEFAQVFELMMPQKQFH